MGLSGWKYYADAPIDNTGNSSDLTDYQIKVNLTSSNFDFTKANSDGSDIRFTDSDGSTLLSYWIEDWDSSGQTATIWVKVPSIPASSTKDIYLYCGNVDATSISNGDGVFIFGQDFRSEQSISSTKWIENLNGGTISWSSDGLIMTNNQGYSASNVLQIMSANTFDFSVNKRIIEKQKTINNNDWDSGIYVCPTTTTQDIFPESNWVVGNLNSSTFYLRKKISGTLTTISTPYAAVNTFHNIELIVLITSTGSVILNIDGSNKYSNTSESLYSTSNNYLYLYSSSRYAGSAVESHFSYFYVSQYSSPEPTISVGALQNNITITSNTLWFGTNF